MAAKKSDQLDPEIKKKLEDVADKKDGADIKVDDSGTEPDPGYTVRKGKKTDTL